jgi:hypothetical protein
MEVRVELLASIAFTLGEREFVKYYVGESAAV